MIAAACSVARDVRRVADESTTAGSRVSAVGDTVGGKYALLRLLGEGGMGRVFEARNLNTGKRVAVKLLHREYAQNPEVVERFLREARTATSVDHPNVVDVLDLDVDAATGAPFIVQEFLVGESLEEHLTAQPEQRLDPARAVTLLIPVLSAMAAAHRKGVVHRDLKPANIFLTRDAQGAVVPKVIDFGIARVAATGGSTEVRRTGTGVIIGTPAYMSPEQAAGEADVGPQTDVWALGAVLYECVSGRLPYEAANHNLVVGKILYEPPTPVTQWVPSLSPDLVAVIDRALTRDRAHRFASVEAMLDALASCDARRPSATPAPPPAQTLASVPPHAPSASLSGWETPRGATTRRRRYGVAAMAVVTAALCAAAIWVSVAPSTHASAPPSVAVAAPTAPPPTPTPAVEPAPPAPVVEAPPVEPADEPALAPPAPVVEAPAPAPHRPQRQTSRRVTARAAVEARPTAPVVQETPRPTRTRPRGNAFDENYP
ncbi:MAG: serine/threonine-protein kinase [Polyangiales bacterium]